VSLKQWINLLLLLVVLFVLVYAAVELLMGDWIAGRRARLDDAEIERVLAQVRVEVESGCTCDGCTYIRSVCAAAGPTGGVL
jgi:hypothetical protein